MEPPETWNRRKEINEYEILNGVVLALAMGSDGFLRLTSSDNKQPGTLNLAHLNLINGDIYHLIFNLRNGWKRINHVDRESSSSAWVGGERGNEIGLPL